MTVRGRDLTNGAQPGCRVLAHHGVFAEAVPEVVFHQDQARSLTWYEPWVLPAITHTSEYAELDLLPRFVSAAEALPHVGARLHRNAWLRSPHRRSEAVFFLHEHTVRHLPVPAAAREAQLWSLGQLVERGTCRLRVLPSGRGRPGVGAAGFQLLRFTDHEPLVIVPGESASLILDGPAHLPAYEAILHEWDTVALSTEDSCELIQALAEDEKRGLSA